MKHPTSAGGDSIVVKAVIDSPLPREIKRAAITKKQFEVWLEQMSVTSLPYSFNERLFLNNWKQYYTSEPNKLGYKIFNDNTCLNYLSYKDSLELNQGFKNGEKFELSACNTKEKIKINDSVFAFIGLAKSNKHLADIIYTFSSDKGIIDIKFLGFEENFEYDLYLHQGILIDKNLKVTSINISYYESPEERFIQEFQILASGKIIDTNKDYEDNETDEEKLNINESKESLKKVKIDWNEIPIHNLPFSTEEFQRELLSGDKVPEKYCCHPRCDQHYELNELDVLFSKNTISNELSEYEGNGHPSQKQGYFILRLPDVNGNKVLVFNYYDGEASDYKLCTMEIQIFDTNLELMDKIIIEDGIAYECSWKRTFSIGSNYLIEITDYSSCIEGLGSDKMINEKTIEGLYKIMDTGKIVQISE